MCHQSAIRTKSKLVKALTLSALTIPLSCWIASCSVNVGLGPGAAQIGVGILGKTFTLTLGNVGAIVFEAKIGVTIPTAFTLFDRTPPEPATSGRMILPTSSVSVGQRLSGKIASQAQSLPLNGSTTVTFKIASGQSAELCDSAVLLSQYDISLTAGSVGVLNEDYELSQPALDIIATNDVTICIDVLADFTGELTIGDFMLTFDDPTKPDLDDGRDPDAGQAVPQPNQSQLALVPIDNKNGRAVRTSVNRTIAGISYGVVGVLEDATSTVTVPTASPNTLTINPSDLGLAVVSRLHMAVHSSFVPDVAEGTRIATLTAQYAGGGAPTALDFILGSNTAEWSFTRIEHTTSLGGVQHRQPSVLYSFKTSVDSSAEYTGYVYSLTLPVDPFRSLSRLTLTMQSPETFPPSRVVTGALSTWAAQAITAITLEGWLLPPPEPIEEEACCTALGTCRQQEPGPCQDAGGIAQGPGTDCIEDAIICGSDDDPPPPPPPDDDPIGACCFVNGDCEDRTRESCEFVLADYQGDGTTCDTVTCTPQIEYVVWYTGNVCCWGAPLLYITDRITFNQPRLRSSFPGGGRDPTEPAIKVEMQGGFASREDGQAWLCPQFTSSSFHFWCGRHYQIGGDNWQAGGLGCEFSSLPDNASPPGLPDANGCADADDTSDVIACCYPNTTCAEVTRADCDAGGGTPHPDGHDRCGVEICPGTPPPCPRDGICDTSCASFDGDRDCDFCHEEGSCITGCDELDPDCCINKQLLKDGGAEDGPAAQDFETSIRMNAPINEGWNVYQGRLTRVAYAIGGPTHLNPEQSRRINGGNNYFSGGPSGADIILEPTAISPTIAQQAVAFADYVPIEVIESGMVRATLSAHLGGFADQNDQASVSVVFRDVFLNDLATMEIGPIKNVDRNNVTTMLKRGTSMMVPTNAATAEVRMSIKRLDFYYNDGYIDNVSLVIEHVECPDNDSDPSEN